MMSKTDGATDKNDKNITSHPDRNLHSDDSKKSREDLTAGSNGDSSCEENLTKESTYDVITTSATSGYSSSSDCHDNHKTRHRIVTSQPPKGALLLGSGDDVYTTRYCIDHEAQTSGLCEEVMYEECVPCCHHSSRSKASKWVWAFLRSEAFVYFLHITSIVFGVAKEAVGVTKEDPFLTLLHTGIETGATLLLLIIRLVGGRNKEKVVAEAIADLEYVDQSEPDTHVRKVKVYINLHTAFSAILIFICVGSFVLFLLIDELGWTLLSNNFCMITTNVVSGLLFTRVSLALVTIREDQFKVTIFESLALIEDLSEAAETLEKINSDREMEKQTVFDQSIQDDIEKDIKFILDDTDSLRNSSETKVTRKIRVKEAFQDSSLQIGDDNNANHNEHHHHHGHHPEGHQHRGELSRNTDPDLWWVSNDITRIDTVPTSMGTAPGRSDNILVVEVKSSTNLETNSMTNSPSNITGHIRTENSKTINKTLEETTQIIASENSRTNLADDSETKEKLETTLKIQILQQSGGSVIGKRTLEDVEEQARRFLEAVEATPLFHQPTHIDVYDLEKERVKNIKELHHQKSAPNNTYL